MTLSRLPGRHGKNEPNPLHASIVLYMIPHYTGILAVWFSWRIKIIYDWLLDRSYICEDKNKYFSSGIHYDWLNMILECPSGTRSLLQTRKRTKIRCSERNSAQFSNRAKNKPNNKKEPSQTKFSVAKHRKKKPKSRNLAPKEPSWQPLTL